MSISSEIARIQQNVTDSLGAVADKGVTVPSGSNSDDLAGLIALITPILQSKTGITPTKSSQTISPDSGYEGLSSVQINAIPSAYQDVTGVTAAAEDVVSGKDIVNSSGTVVHGSLVIQHYYTGSSAPSSSLGVNGDVYLQA